MLDKEERNEIFEPTQDFVGEEEEYEEWRKERVINELDEWIRLMHQAAHRNRGWTAS